MNLKKHIWEGWTVQCFINALEPSFDIIISGRSYMKPFKTNEELKEWLKSNQPYYKKYIPEVFKYFKNKTNL